MRWNINHLFFKHKQTLWWWQYRCISICRHLSVKPSLTLINLLFTSSLFLIWPTNSIIYSTKGWFTVVKLLWLPVHVEACALTAVRTRVKRFWQEFCCSSCPLECRPAALKSLAPDLRSASATLWPFIANSTESV